MMSGEKPCDVLIDDIAAKMQLLSQAHNAKRHVRQVLLPQLRRLPDLEVPELQGGGKKVQVRVVRL